ncbi:MAG: ABC transporter permease [Oscillospiraceae bacterium]|nr:ABC transporter permease [Oscillospiraceae bacterium]
MRFTENFRYALNAIALNKKRSFLTMIGIIVGLSAVITIVSIGDTVSFIVKEFFMNQFGGNTVTMYSVGDDYKSNSKYSFTQEDIDKFIEGAPASVDDILLSSDLVYNGKAVVNDNSYSDTTVKGVSPGDAKALKLKIISGRFLIADDCKNCKPVAVISDIAAINCFGSVENALGKQLKIQGEYEGYSYNMSDLDAASMDPAMLQQNMTAQTVQVGQECVVVGIYQFEDTQGKLNKINDQRNFSTDVYCPYTYQDYIGDITKDVYGPVLQFICSDNSSMPEAKAYATRFLSQRFTDDESYQYFLFDITESLSAINSVIKVITVVFVMVAAVSLLVGGIGLMNTMLVSVTERTKEIGIKKALGAKKSTIRSQFLTESVMICLIACAIGVFFGMLAGTIIESNLDKIINLVDNATLRYFLKNTEIHVTPSLSAVIISVIFSITVGSVFGLYPANKGAKMQPVDALRYE